MLSLGLSQAAAASEPAPPIEGADMQTGHPVSLAANRGKVVFVDFWASWCPPCLASLPAYENLYREIGGADFEVIAVNVDEDTEDGLRFLEQHPVSYPVVADPKGDIGIPWNIRSLPRSFLLNREGEILATFKRYRTGDEQKIKQQVLEMIRADNSTD
jgi:thiol-disulfide isomerase/thioredoxin